MAKVIHGKGIARLRAQLATMDRARLEVGFFDTAVYPSGVPVAYIATIHEFGYPAGGIPARPFMRPTIEAQRTKWASQFKGGFKAVANGQIDVRGVMEQMGALIAGQVKDGIQAVNSPALLDATVKARLRKLADGGKGAQGTISKPLVATGQMLNSVEYKVTV